MQTLSKEAEEQIIGAVKQAVALVDGSNLTPDAAIEKVARQYKWAGDMIRFASHAYNTGRQAAQRETAASALDKFASFPLADPDKVIGAIYPATVKSAAEEHYAMSVDPGYDAPPLWTAPRAQAERLAVIIDNQKAASCTCPVCGQDPCKSDCGHTKAMLAKKSGQDVYTAHLQLKKAAEEARHQAAVAYERLLGSMGKLAEYFKKAAMDRVPFAHAEYAAQTYFGDAGSTLMDYVYTRNKMREPRADGLKLARDLVKFAPEVEPFNLLRSCIDLGKNVQEKRAAELLAREAMDRQVNDELAPFVAAPTVKTSWDLVQGQVTTSTFTPEQLRPFASARPQVKAAAAVVPVTPAAWNLLTGKQAGLFEAVGGGMIGSTTKGLIDRAMGGGTDQASAVDDRVMDLEDPAHEDKLKQIRTQTMLSDLMSDDVIGGYDPNHVLSAYNEISQLAPRTAQQPMAVRALLKRQLQGNMEPFETQQITQIEKGLKDTQNPLPSLAKVQSDEKPD